MAYNLDKLISAIEKQNEQLGKLIQRNETLHNTPFDMTSIEKIKMLSEEVAELGEKFDDSLSKANKHFSGLFTDKSKIIDDLSEATKRLRDNLQKVQDEQNKLDKALQKISEHEEKFGKNINNMTASQQKYYKKLKDAANRYRKQLKTEKEEYEENKDALTDLRNASSEYYSKANEEQEKLNKRIVEGTHAMDDAAEKWEQRSRALRKGASEVSKGLTQIYQSAKKTLEPWAKANQESMNYARTMGMSQKTADAYLSKTVAWAAKNNIGILFNKSTDELIKMQSKYSEVLGRNVQLTSEQKKDMLAMEQFLGEDGMIDIANNLENFGLGMSDSAEFIHKQMSEAAKSGIAASKLTKTIRENIKMAQDYTFKNGLDGLASMAKKAIQLKTDMSLVNGFLEKTSTVEGAITTGANLQVLGGNYAVGANPLSMLYESLNDTEGMFDRAVNMTKGKVFYNNESGNFEMSGFDRYMMKHAATQMGIDPSKLIDVAFREASLNKIESEAKRSKIGNDEDMVELVKNLATWDKGSAWVNIDGKETKVSDLTHEDKAKLEAMQKTDSQNLQDMAINLRSITDVISGTEKEIANEQANAIKDVGQGVTNMLKTNTGILNTMSKIGAWINIISGGLNIGHGIFAVNSGILRVVMGMRNMAGMGNLFGGKGGKLGKVGKAGRYGGGLRGLRNSFKATKGNIITSTSGTQYKSLGGGKLLNMANGKTVTGAVTNNVVKSGSLTKLGTAAKFTRFGGGAAAGAISLGVDALTGDLKKDTEASIGRAVGATAGAVIGSFFGPVGTMVGGMIGTAITGAIQDAQKEKRAELRSKIAEEISQSMPELSSLFDGVNALVGNYNKKQLEQIKNALSDNILEEGELSGATLRKAQANNDIVKMRDAGVDVRVEYAKGGYLNRPRHSNAGTPILGSDISVGGVEYAKGGYLNGPRHSEGGMPILGSDISVEGGEFVVNKEATKKYKPLLEKINSNNFSITPNEPRHSDGGMFILGSDISVEDGGLVVNKEATKKYKPFLNKFNNNFYIAQNEPRRLEDGGLVVNKKTTKKYKPLLDKINGDSFSITPNEPLLDKFNNNFSITPNEPLGKQMKVNSSSYGLLSMPNNAKISFEPISLNMSGTIKVECGNKQMDITNDLMNNPLFINKLTEMISKQLNKIDNGAYNMSISKQKFV
jgi:hypothetical protein